MSKTEQTIKIYGGTGTDIKLVYTCKCFKELCTHNLVSNSESIGMIGVTAAESLGDIITTLTLNSMIKIRQYISKL